MKTALSIAGFDASSGAGISADLMVFAAHGIYGTACITALTVQSTLGVQSVEPVDARVVRETLDCVTGDIPPKGIKIGMLGDASVVREVIRFLDKLPGQERIPVVLDPVLWSSSGYPLLDEEGLRQLGILLGLVTWATPNIVELAAITARNVVSREDVAAAVSGLQTRYPRLNVVVTGGDQEKPEEFLRVAGCAEEHWFQGNRLDSRSTHGTGCAFSSALLSRLVLGEGPMEAVAGAKAYVAEAIRLAPEGIGRGHGPLNHLWPLKHR